MKASELRLGNWVNYPIHDEIAEVKDYIDTSIIDAEDIMFIEKNDDNCYVPIPITEEWLLKLGFEKTDDFGDQVYYEPKGQGKRGYYICFDHDDISFGLIAFGDCTNLIYDSLHLQHVHQLQNLYFALTGEELTIKE